MAWLQTRSGRRRPNRHHRTGLPCVHIDERSLQARRTAHAACRDRGDSGERRSPNHLAGFEAPSQFQRRFADRSATTTTGGWADRLRDDAGVVSHTRYSATRWKWQTPRYGKYRRISPRLAQSPAANPAMLRLSRSARPIRPRRSNHCLCKASAISERTAFRKRRTSGPPCGKPTLQPNCTSSASFSRTRPTTRWLCSMSSTRSIGQAW